MEIADCPSISVVAKDGDLNLLVYLIEHVGKSVNSTNPHGWTPLHLAVYYNRQECVDYLLSLDETRIDAETHAGETALLLACRNYYTVPSSMVQKLVSAGADVNLVQNDSKSPLYCICEGPNNPGGEFYRENLAKAEILINNGANLNTPESFEGDTPLFAAIEEENLDLVKMLLYAGADANFQREYEDCAPIIIAAQTDNYPVFKELLPFVVDVNVKTCDGRTALMLAQNEQIIKLLMEHGADPNIIAVDKPITAVHLAAFRHNLNKLILLLPRTRDSIICSCEEYNLISLIVDTSDGHHDLKIVFDCLRYLMSLNIDNSVFFIPFFHTYAYPPIAALFIPCVVTASDDLWCEYLSLFYLFLSKGINVNAEGNEKCLLSYFVQVYTSWNSRIEQILRILINHGLNADSFVAFFFNKYFLFETSQYQMQFIMHLVPYFFTHGHRFYKHFQRSGQDMTDLLSCSEFERTFATDNLKNYCRSLIRKQIKVKCNTTSDYLQCVNSLQIPKCLKDYIRFKFY